MRIRAGLRVLPALLLLVACAPKPKAVQVRSVDVAERCHVKTVATPLIPQRCIADSYNITFEVTAGGRLGETSTLLWEKAGDPPKVDSELTVIVRNGKPLVVFKGDEFPLTFGSVAE